MTSRAAVIAGLLVMLAACRGENFSRADGRVLCDPHTREAFIVERGAGDTSFVSPMPSASLLCAVAR